MGRVGSGGVSCFGMWQRFVARLWRCVSPGGATRGGRVCPFGVLSLVAPSILAGAKEAPAISDYWKPPTAYYGAPLYGGEMRMNYEDPLEHGNIWGAYTGAAVRLRSVTMNHLVQTDPYDSGKIIPDLVGADQLRIEVVSVSGPRLLKLRISNGAAPAESPPTMGDGRSQC